MIQWQQQLLKQHWLWQWCQHTNGDDNNLFGREASEEMNWWL